MCLRVSMAVWMCVCARFLVQNFQIVETLLLWTKISNRFSAEAIWRTGLFAWKRNPGWELMGDNCWAHPKSTASRVRLVFEDDKRTSLRWRKARKCCAVQQSSDSPEAEAETTPKRSQPNRRKNQLNCYVFRIKLILIKWPDIKNDSWISIKTNAVAGESNACGSNGPSGHQAIVNFKASS